MDYEEPGKTVVCHCIHDEFDIYIARDMPRKSLKDVGFGNPFVIGRDGDRSEVIEQYRVWLRQQPELVERVKRELKGKRLACWCRRAGQDAPACHGDVLVNVAEGGG